MSTKFLADNAWGRLRDLGGKRGRRFVAVPFLGKGASRRLPLRKGDTLVIRCDRNTVAKGLTFPPEVARYLKKGVAVYKQANLHAKVFVFGKTVVVGSTNVSSNSEESLVEAAIETTDTAVVALARGFVTELAIDRVTPNEVEALKTWYRPPKIPGGKRRKTTKKHVLGAGHSAMWAVALTQVEWDDHDLEAEEKQTPVARKRLKNSNLYRLDDFITVGKGYAKDIAVGHRVLMVTTHGRGKRIVTGPGNVVLKHSFRVGREYRTLFFLEHEKKQARRNIKTLVSLSKSVGNALKGVKIKKRIRSHAMIYEIGRLWAK